MKAYLLLYNLLSAAGWAYVLYEAVTAFANGATPEVAWSKFGYELCVVQSMAGAEILHSLLRLVRSPVSTVFVQVASRFTVLWLFTYNFAAARAHWSLYLMVISWSTVEVPRYLFYAVNLFTDKVPFPLFWLRYSLFGILYPSGITGEILQIVSSMPSILRISVFAWYGTVGLLTLYAPGSPYMIFHMIAQRKKAFKARKEGKNGPAPPPSRGIDFPLDPKTSTRSTTIVNQGAFVASIAKVDPKSSAAAAAEKNWRFGYAKHVVRNVELCCTSTENAVAIAREGLDYLYKNFEFVLADGKSISIDEAMKSIGGTFHTYTITGNKPRDPNFEFSVPYQKFQTKEVKRLSGEALAEQLNRWVTKGVMEADARDAILNVARNKDYTSTALKDKYFVLLGAGSAMGPLRVLLELGANIIAVDIDREFVWKRLINLTRESSGTLIFPVKKPAAELKTDDDICKNAGANLLVQTPEICTWVKSLFPGKQLIIGAYAYLDSALFVRLALAMDAIIRGVLAERKNAAIAFLCSPTDVFVTDDACHEARRTSLKRIPLWQKLLKLVLPKRMLTSNVLRQVEDNTGAKYSIVDGLAVAQGPNYALAKRLQHWRCMIARNDNYVVSTHIAPSTATESVVHNPQFAAAYIGMKFFRPMEIVYQDVSNSIMTALLVNDVCNPNSAAQPTTNIGNPVRLFARGSCHFGIWRMAFKCGSIGEVSAIIGYLSIYAAYVNALAAGFVGFLGFIYVKGAPHTWF